MKVWRVLMALSFLLLGGCLVSFKESLPAEQAAPAALLGKWTSKNAWGEPLDLQIKRVADHRYQATRLGRAGAREVYDFTVARHGNRWYLSAAVPGRFGGHFALAGFELNARHELVLYSLDPEPINQALGQQILAGAPFSTEAGDGVLIDSALPRVFAFLDDPANSDVFVEAARFQRVGQ